MRAREKPRGMELHHLHVAQREPRTQRHGETVAALVAGGRVIAIHRRSATRGKQYRLCTHEEIVAGAHVDEEHTRDRRAVRRLDQLDGAMLLQALNAPCPYLLG